MCGRYTNTAGIDEINDHFAVSLKGEAGTRRFNVAPAEEVLALVAPLNGEVEPRLLRWGLVPSGCHSRSPCYGRSQRSMGVGAERRVADVRCLPESCGAGIHNRVLVVVADRATQRAWLSSALDAAEAAELCGSLLANRLSARPANPVLHRVGESRGALVC
jgi:putative SOS response-associated peptidase YedK